VSSLPKTLPELTTYQLAAAALYSNLLQVDRVEGVLTAQDLDLKLRSLLEGPAPNRNSN